MIDSHPSYELYDSTLSQPIKKASNARINRAGSIVASLQVLRMKGKLIPLRFNELLGAAWYEPR